MNSVALISLAAAVLVLAAIPGPGVFATIAKSITAGLHSALALIAGIVTGDIIYLMFAVFGLSIVAKVLGEFFIIVKICGGGYLFWLGFKIFFSKSPEKSLKETDANHSRPGNFIIGLFITLSNPKVILFYCGFLPTFMDFSAFGIIDITLAAGVVAAVLSTVLITYAYLAIRARKLFFSRIAAKRLNRTAGGLMMATGITIAVKS